MPIIVYGDDNPRDLVDLLPRELRRQFKEFDPRDKDESKAAFEAAAESDLWVFDYFYSEDPSQEVALNEDNGLTTFQKWRRLKQEERPPTALVSNDLERAIGPSLAPGREHVLALRAGVEWVGDKTKDSAEFLVALASASEAVQADIMAQTSAGSPDRRRSSNENLCLKLLKAPNNAAWHSSAERQLDRARPPQLSSVEHPQAKARVMLAWLLHNVLPYPSFLISLNHAAARIGIASACLKRLSESAAVTPLTEALAVARYRGPLGGEFPVRFWRAGIDGIVWSFSQQNRPYAETIQEAAHMIKIEMLDVDDPVVVSNIDLVETGEITSSQNCVRAQDEHFPPDVPPAWVRLEDARDHVDFADKVLFEDRVILEVNP